MSVARVVLVVLAGAFAFGLLAVADDEAPPKPAKKPIAKKVKPGPPKTRKAGTEWAGNSLAMKLCWCPPGEFLMGSPASEKGRSDNEAQVKVQLSEGFWLGKFEVTQAEYVEIIGSNPSDWVRNAETAQVLRDVDLKLFPIDRIKWPDALEFCEKLTQREKENGRLLDGWEYRLPTEAQWEYACRAGTKTPFAFGESLGPDDANRRGTHRLNFYTPTMVGSYRANAWGLCDMHGNIEEWCADAYVKELPGGRDPFVEGSNKDVERVHRGGMYVMEPKHCRSAQRSGVQPNVSGTIGFRVALVPVPKEKQKDKGE